MWSVMSYISTLTHTLYISCLILCFYAQIHTYICLHLYIHTSIYIYRSLGTSSHQGQTLFPLKPILRWLSFLGSCDIALSHVRLPPMFLLCDGLRWIWVRTWLSTAARWFSFRGICFQTGLLWKNLQSQVSALLCWVRYFRFKVFPNDDSSTAAACQSFGSTQHVNPYWITWESTETVMLSRGVIPWLHHGVNVFHIRWIVNKCIQFPIYDQIPAKVMASLCLAQINMTLDCYSY